MSRPRKKILLCYEDEVRRDVLCFQLDLWGYAVQVVARAELAAELHVGSYQMVLVVPVEAGSDREWNAFMGWMEYLDEVQRERGELARVCDLEQVLPEFGVPYALRLPSSCGSAHLLRDALRTALVRRRGPRWKQVRGVALARPVFQPDMDHLLERARKAMVA